MRPRIVHLTTVHRAFDTRILFKECRSLAKTDVAVVLLACASEAIRFDGVLIKPLPQPHSRLQRMSTLLLEVARRADMEDADLYHFHDPELIPVGMHLISRGKIVVYDVHEDLPRAVLSKHYLPRICRRPLMLACDIIEGFAAGRFSALVAATQTIGERCRRLNLSTVVIRNFPVRDELFAATKTEWRSRPNAVAYVGGIYEQRGIREMVDALPLIAPRLGVTLTLAGPYENDDFRKQLHSRPGWSQVHEFGFISRTQMSAVFSGARAGLLLNHPEPNCINSEPNKLFEYMSAGLPVIASDFPLWRSIIEDAGCGLLVPPLDAPAAANAIEYLMTHPEQAQAMGDRGRAAVEGKFNWETEESKLYALYECLLGIPLRPTFTAAGAIA